MGPNSGSGKINVSETTYNLVKEQYSYSNRRGIAVKGAGKKSM